MCCPFCSICSPFKEAKKAVKAATNALQQYEDDEQVQHLTTAITHYRHAYETSNAKYTAFPDIIINYTALLNKQARLSGEKSNPKKMIGLLEEARAVMEKQSKRSSSQAAKYGVLLNNLGHAYLAQYQMSKTSQDRKSATSTFERARSQDISSPGSSIYTTSLIGSATALWTACELQPQDDGRDLSRLSAAIEFLETALRQNEQNIEVRAECYGHLAPVYDLRYKKNKDRNDLDSSIKYYKESLAMLKYQNPNRAPTLFNLSKQQFERHTLTKGPEDLKAAESNITALLDEGRGTQDLKTKIEVLRNDMDSYRKRTLSDNSALSVSGESGGASASHQTTISEEPRAYSTGTIRSDSSRQNTFTAGPSVAQRNWLSMDEGVTSVTGQPRTIEPAELDSNHYLDAPIRKVALPKESEHRLHCIPGQPQVAESGPSAQITPGHRQKDVAGKNAVPQYAATPITPGVPQHK